MTFYVVGLSTMVKRAWAVVGLVLLSACATKDAPRVSREPRAATVERATLEDGTRQRTECGPCALNGRCMEISGTPTGGGYECCPQWAIIGGREDAEGCLSAYPELRTRRDLQRICWGATYVDTGACTSDEPDACGCLEVNAASVR